MLNNFSCMGRFTHTPELKTTANNNEVIKFSLAVNRSRANANGEKITDFIDCVAWNKTAEFINKFFKKGDPIIVEGRLETRTYEDKKGNKRKVCEVIVKEIHFCAFSKKDNLGDNQEQEEAMLDHFEEDLPF